MSEVWLTIGCAALVAACGSSRSADPPPRTLTVEMPALPPEPADDSAAAERRSRRAELGLSCEKSDSQDALASGQAARNRGTQAIRDKRFDQALSAFREAYSATCANAPLFLMAVALEQLGDLDAAAAIVEEYRRLEGSEIGQRRARSYLACIQRRKSGAQVDCISEELSKPP